MGLQRGNRTALLQEAKEKLEQLQAKPRTSSSSQAGEDLPSWGRNMTQVKALLKPTEEYGLDELGRLVKERMEEGIKTGDLI